MFLLNYNAKLPGSSMFPQNFVIHSFCYFSTAGNAFSPSSFIHILTKSTLCVTKTYISSNTHSLSYVLFATHDKNTVEQAQKLFHSFMHTQPYTIYHTYIHYCPLTGSTCARVCMLVMHADTSSICFLKLALYPLKNIATNSSRC